MMLSLSAYGGDEQWQYYASVYSLYTKNDGTINQNLGAFPSYAEAEAAILSVHPNAAYFVPWYTSVYPP